jgi:hypothetical protein
MMVMTVLDCVRAVVSTLAGGVNGTNGAFVDASGTNAGFDQPMGLSIDASGNVLVADWNNHRIRKVTAGGGMLLREGRFRALSCSVFRVWLGLQVASMRVCVYTFAPSFVCLSA